MIELNIIFPEPKYCFRANYYVYLACKVELNSSNIPALAHKKVVHSLDFSCCSLCQSRHQSRIDLIMSFTGLKSMLLPESRSRCQ